MKWSLIAQEELAGELRQDWIAHSENGSIVVEERCCGPLTFDVYDVEEQLTRVVIPPRSCDRFAHMLECEKPMLIATIISLMRTESSDICDLMDLLDVMDVRYLYELPGDDYITLRGNASLLRQTAQTQGTA